MKFKNCAAITGTLVALSEEDCTTHLKQAKRFAYQKLGQPLNQITPANVLVKGTWDPLLAATDDTKIILPRKLLYNPEGGGTEPVKNGSNDNSTPDGRSQVMGETVPMFTGSYNGLSPADFKAVGELFGWANKSVDFETIGIHVFLGDTQVMTMKDGSPIPIRSAFIGTPTWGQLHTPTFFAIQFELLKDWYADVAIYDLNFKHSQLRN